MYTQLCQKNKKVFWTKQDNKVDYGYSTYRIAKVDYGYFTYRIAKVD